MSTRGIYRKVLIANLMNGLFIGIANKRSHRSNHIARSNYYYPFYTRPQNVQFSNPFARTYNNFNLNTRVGFYNYTGSRRGSIFNRFLPYRNSIKYSPLAVARYEGLVNYIINRVSIIDYQNNHLTEASSAMKYLVSASIVELFHNRPDLIEKAINRPEGMTIILADFPRGSKTAGIYDALKRNDIIIGKKEFLRGLANPHDQYNVLAHEFVHAVDAEGTRHITDGIFSEFTDSEIAIFIRERDRLKRYGYFYGIERYALTKTNDEFLATIAAETFLEAPLRLYYASPAMYQLLSRFFRYDPLRVNYA